MAKTKGERRSPPSALVLQSQLAWLHGSAESPAVNFLIRYLPAFSFSHFFASSLMAARFFTFQPSFSVRPSRRNRLRELKALHSPPIQSASSSASRICLLSSAGIGSCLIAFGSARGAER